jgi:IS5 family transposase
MNAPTGVDAHSGLIHSVIATAARVHEISLAQALLHEKDTRVYAGAGYRGIKKRGKKTGLLARRDEFPHPSTA